MKESGVSGGGKLAPVISEERRSLPQQEAASFAALFNAIMGHVLDLAAAICGMILFIMIASVVFG